MPQLTSYPITDGIDGAAGAEVEEAEAAEAHLEFRGGTADADELETADEPAPPPYGKRDAPYDDDCVTC